MSKTFADYYKTKHFGRRYKSTKDVLQVNSYRLTKHPYVWSLQFLGKGSSNLWVHSLKSLGKGSFCQRLLQIIILRLNTLVDVIRVPKVRTSGVATD